MSSFPRCRPQGSPGRGIAGLSRVTQMRENSQVLVAAARQQPASNPGVTPQHLESCFGVSLQLLWSHTAASGMVKAATRENQVKLTVSVPPSLHVLLRSWALCEGRELTSVVLQCVELSVRQLKSSNSIPTAAVRAYETACEERLAVGGL